MKFEWDENKRQENIRRHGLDFVEAQKMFNYPMLVRLDTRYDYGEDRYIGIGMANGRVLVIVYTERDHGNTIRIISLRKALKYECKQYEKHLSN